MTWRIGRVGRTVLRFHPAALLMAAYLLLLGHGDILLAGTASILAHEAAHAIAAALLGWPPQSLELTPLGALMRLDDEARMPPLRRALMISAGPAMSLLLCGLALQMTLHGVLPVAAGRCMFLCNLGIVLVNLIPALPLDGGRLTAALLSRWLSGGRVRALMRGSGRLFGVCMIVGNLAWSYVTGGLNLSLSFAGCFLIYAADRATVSAALDEMTARLARARLLAQRKIMSGSLLIALDTCPLRDAAANLPPDRPACIAILRAEDGSLCRIVGDQELVRCWLNAPEARCDQLCLH